MRGLLVLFCATAIASPAFALTEPQPVTPDEPRVRRVEYVPDAVTKLVVPATGETQVVLSDRESGEIKISLAQASWRKSHGGGSSIIFSPNSGATTTYAHVVSYLPNGKTRRYTFELRVAPAPDNATVAVASADGTAPVEQPSYAAGYAVVRFTYAAADKEQRAEDAIAAKKAAKEQWLARRTAPQIAGPPVVHALASTGTRRRCDFWWRGSATLLPQAACDRGHTTTFLWDGQVPVPSIYVIDPDGSEQAVTASPDPERPGQIVVQRTAARWLLRSGKKSVVELYNSAFDPLWEETPADPIAPPQRLTRR